MLVKDLILIRFILFYIVLFLFLKSKGLLDKTELDMRVLTLKSKAEKSFMVIMDKHEPANYIENPFFTNISSIVCILLSYTMVCILHRSHPEKPERVEIIFKTLLDEGIVDRCCSLTVSHKNCMPLFLCFEQTSTHSADG